MGKTRVAPLKPQTIPKLELQAAVYSCRLQRAFIKNTTLSVSKITHWTDSTVVLHWIYNINNRQKTYIANRLHEIRHTTAINDWKYVATKLNPADEGTRGIKTTELKHSQWMNGPAFLKLPSHLWPRTIEDTTPSTQENMPTSKTDDIQTYSLICNTPHTFMDYKQFSSWKRLLRTTFYILKTLDLAKRRLSTVKERYQQSKDKIKAFQKTSRTSKEHKPLKHAARLSTSTHISIKKEHFDHSADFKKPQSAFE